MASPRGKPRTKPSTSGDVIVGHATIAGTARFSERFAASFSSEFYRPLADGIRVSSIGMGTYLGDCDDAEDARYVTVVGTGLERGLNFIDTAINYRCQRSERAVGKAIKQAIKRGAPSCVSSWRAATPGSTRSRRSPRASPARPSACSNPGAPA